MHLEISNPNKYPFGLMSILHRELGKSIAEDAIKVSIPQPLRVTLPIIDDNMYFTIVLNNFKNALEEFVLKHATDAAIFRIKKFFMDDVAQITDFNIQKHTLYTQKLAWLISSPLDYITKSVVNKNELAYLIEAILADLRNNKIVENGTYAELLERYNYTANVPVSFKNINVVTDVNAIVQQLKVHYKQETRNALIVKIKETLLDKHMDIVLEKQYPWLDVSQYQKAKEEQLVRHHTGNLENKLFTLWTRGEYKDYITDLTQEQINMVLSYEIKTDPITGKHIDRETLARVVDHVKQDLLALVDVQSMPWRDLLKKFKRATGTTASISFVLNDKITDVNDIVNIVKTATFLERQQKLIRIIKERLMKKYFMKTDLLPPKAKELFKEYNGDIDARLFKLWYNKLISVQLDVPYVVIQELLFKPDREFTALFTDLAYSGFSDVDKFFVDFPRLRIDYRHAFVYENGFYMSPLEYGYRKALALFDPYISVRTTTKMLPATLTRYSVLKFTQNVQTAIATLFWDKCKEPHMWSLLNAGSTLEWRMNADFVDKDWLTEMYNSAKKTLKRSSILDKPPVMSDLTVDPMIRFWFIKRIAMWKQVSIYHKRLFNKLTEKFNVDVVRLPTDDEKRFMEGCETDVWQVIFSEFVTFAGTREHVYSKIINEILERLPVVPSLSNLCEFFKPIYDADNMGYSSVMDMVKSIIGDYTDYSLIILWTRLFVK